MNQNAKGITTNNSTEERPNIQVIIAHIHSAWNCQKRFIVNGSRGGFSTDQWLCCSRLRANVQVLGPKVPTFRVIYQQVLAWMKLLAKVQGGQLQPYVISAQEGQTKEEIRKLIVQDT